MSIDVVESVRHDGGRWTCSPARASGPPPDVLPVGWHLRLSGARDLASVPDLVDANTDYVAVAIGHGLMDPTEVHAAAHHLVDVAPSVPHPLLLWTTRGSMAQDLCSLIDLTDAVSGLRLAVDVPELYSGHEMSLGAARTWRRAIGRLALAADVIITGTSTAEHADPTRRPTISNPTALGAQVIARHRQRLLVNALRRSPPTRLVRRTAPPPRRVGRRGDASSDSYPTGESG